MKNRWRFVVLFAIASVAHPLAWGPTGHRVVAEVAQRHLSPAARERVTRLLAGRSLADVVNWPDELRSDPRFDKYKPLHFATVPNGVTSAQVARHRPSRSTSFSMSFSTIVSTQFRVTDSDCYTS